MAFWILRDSSVKLATQDTDTQENTTDGDFVSLECEAEVAFETEIQELDLLTGQAGAAPETVPGKRGGTVTLRVPAQGLKEGYDPTSEDPGDAGVLPPWFALLGSAMGSASDSIGGSGSTRNTNFWKGDGLSVSQNYVGGDVSSATTSAITVQAASGSNYAPGDLIVAGTDVNELSPQAGYIKSIAGDVLTLFEASRNSAAASDDTYGTATAFISNDEQIPLTMRWTGNASTLCYRLVGLKFDSATISLNAGEVPVVEFSGRFLNFIADNQDGGLDPASDYVRVAPLLGTRNGRATIAGTATDGLTDMSMTINCNLQQVPSHSADQGVSEQYCARRTVELTVTIPHNTGDTIYDAAGISANEGAHEWQSALELQGSKSVGIYSGLIGSTFAALVANGKISAVPGVTDSDGRLSYALTIRASNYTGDGSSSGAGNSVARISLA